jgi:hypothetical protein
LGENAVNRDPLSELLSGDPEREYGDCASDQNRRDELLASAKPHVRRDFQLQWPASQTATVWGDATVQVPQATFWQIKKR